MMPKRYISEKEKDFLKDLEQYNEKYWEPPEKDQMPGVEQSSIESIEPADLEEADSKNGRVFSGKEPVSLEDLIREVGETFQEVLFRRIDERGMTDVDVYNRANMDRKLFSKIRSNPAYHPRKNTVLALAIALRLNMEETKDLLSRAGYAFSPGSKSDVIIRYFIERGVYDINLINIVLDEHGQAILE